MRKLRLKNELRRVHSLQQVAIARQRSLYSILLSFYGRKRRKLNESGAHRHKKYNRRERKSFMSRLFGVYVSKACVYGAGKAAHRRKIMIHTPNDGKEIKLIVVVKIFFPPHFFSLFYFIFYREAWCGCGDGVHLKLKRTAGSIE